VDEHRETAGPGERTRRFVRWTLAHGRWLWLAALVAMVPSTVALVRLYLNLTSEIEELLPRNAPSVGALDELRQRLSGLSRVWVVDLRYRRRAPRLDSQGFTLTRSWRIGDIWLFLYTRSSGT